MADSERNWSELLPDEDFAFRFGFRRGSPDRFFGPTDEEGSILAERRRWLDEAPERYSAHREEGDEALVECLELAGDWATIPREPPGLDAIARCRWLGRNWEPDFLLLRPVDGRMRLVGGCVCFPSSWRLADKLGCSVAEIHTPVPGLNAELETAIDRFLAKLKPGAAATRSNWGLSRSPERNHDPDRGLPQLERVVEVGEVFLRIEHQALVALPRSGGVLFGIRLEIVPLDVLLGSRAAARGLERALRTMPEAVARYKGLSESRGRLAAICRRAADGD